MSDIDELNSDEYDPDLDDDGDDVFRVRDALEPPRQHPISTQDLHGLIHQGLVDLNPSYQRDVVWPESKQIGLIDSIFRNFYIPPVIFAVQKDDDGEEIRTCVDGKQRLTSISKFMDGQVRDKIEPSYRTNGFDRLPRYPVRAHHAIFRRNLNVHAKDRDPVTKKKYWYTRSDNQSKSRLELPEPYKKQFQRKQITCVEYIGLVPGTERDIFQRVQLGMSLTAAEKLQAISSPLAQWISQLQAMYVGADGGLAEHIKWDTSRGRDFQSISQLCFCCWHFPAFVVPTYAKLEKWLTSNNKPSLKFKNQVSSVLQSLLHLATEEEYQQAFTQIDKRVAPVEFVFIGILLAKMRDCSWEERADEVLAMRQYTRALHKDVRSNERVMKSMWAFVEKVKTPKADPYEGWEAPGAELDAPKRKPARKRKRKDTDDTDETFRPAVTKNSISPAKTRSKPEKEITYSGVRFVA